MKDGYASKSANSLLQSAPSIITDSTVNTLNMLHPIRESSVYPLLPSSAPYNHIASKYILSLSRLLIDNGSSPGPSGWTGDMINTLIKFGDSIIHQSLSLLLSLIINGQLTGEVKTCLLMSTLHTN